MIKKGVTERDINRIYEFIQVYGGLQSASEYALSYAEKAKQTLALIQNGPEKENALSFVDYVINRKK